MGTESVRRDVAKTTDLPGGMLDAVVIDRGLDGPLAAGDRMRERLAHGGLRTVDADPATPRSSERRPGQGAVQDGALRAVLVSLIFGAAACGARTELARGADAGAVDRDDAGPPCRPTLEACNRVDDDCDGAIDEGLGFGEVRPRVVVRSTQGTTGDCSSCQWAGGAQVWLHDTGILAIWRMGFDGSRPQPNVWARRLDRDATPLGDPFPVFDTPVPDGLRLASIDATRAALAFCGRFDGGSDLMASAFVGPRGEVLVAPARRPSPDLGCGAMHPDVAWSGERVLFAWTNNRGLMDGRAVFLDVADREGRSTGGGEVVGGGGDLSVPPRFARGHGGVAMVTGVQPEPRITRLAFRLYAPDGAERASAEFDAPRGTRWGDTDIAASSEGWLVVGTDRTSFDEPVGRPTIRLDRDGRAIEGPVLVEPGYEWSVVELEPLPGRGFVLAGLLRDPDGAEGLAVMRLDERGRRVDLWRPDPPTWLGLSGFDLVVGDGRILVIHAGPAADGMPNEVLLHELGCVE